MLGQLLKVAQLVLEEKEGHFLFATTTDFVCFGDTPRGSQNSHPALSTGSAGGAQEAIWGVRD